MSCILWYLVVVFPHCACACQTQRQPDPQPIHIHSIYYNNRTNEGPSDRFDLTYLLDKIDRVEERLDVEDEVDELRYAQDRLKAYIVEMEALATYISIAETFGETRFRESFQRISDQMKPEIEAMRFVIEKMKEAKTETERIMSEK